MDIIISAGHGGTDPGATSADGRAEREMTAEQGNLIAKHLKTLGHVVTVQREEYSANNFRVRSRSGYDIAVSLHFNSFNGKATGTEILYKNSSAIASRVLTAITGALGLANRGLKKRTDLFMLNIGFDCLIETCFIDNASDLRCYEERKEYVAKAIAYAIVGEPVRAERIMDQEARYRTQGSVAIVSGGATNNIVGWTNRDQELIGTLEGRWLRLGPGKYVDVSPSTGVLKMHRYRVVQQVYYRASGSWAIPVGIAKVGTVFWAVPYSQWLRLGRGKYLPFVQGGKTVVEELK